MSKIIIGGLSIAATVLVGSSSPQIVTNINQDQSEYTESNQTALHAGIIQTSEHSGIWSEEELKEYIKNKAIDSGVDPAVAISVMTCETPWNWDKEKRIRYYDPNKSQSRLTYNTNQITRHPDWGEVGETEKSFGPWQYHLPDHPDMTIKDASSVEKSTSRAMVDLKSNPKKWTCYK